MRLSRLGQFGRALCLALAAMFTVLAASGAVDASAEEPMPGVGEPLEVLAHAPDASLPLDRVTLTVDGVSREYTVGIGTVEKLLSVAEAEVGEFDLVRPSEGTPLVGGMDIVILRATVRSVSYAEAIPYATEQIPNEYIPRGTENVLSEGVTGEQVTTYDVVEVAGQVVARGERTTVVTREPVSKVVEYGPGGTIVTPDGRSIDWSYKIDGSATAYTTDGFADKTNALGRVAREGTVAVDPKVIPMLSKLYIAARDDRGVRWTYGECVAEDTGGAVKGNIVDLYFDTLEECYEFGRRYCTIYVIEE